MTTRNSTAKDLVITRVFDAPRELVWKAWTDPESFKNGMVRKASPRHSPKSIYASGGQAPYLHA